jgi:hypothetical protein
VFSDKKAARWSSIKEQGYVAKTEESSIRRCGDMAAKDFLATENWCDSQTIELGNHSQRTLNLKIQ